MTVAQPVIIGCEEAAKMRLNAKDAKEIPGNESHGDHLAAIFTDQAGGLYALAGKARKNGVTVAQRQVKGM